MLSVFWSVDCDLRTVPYELQKGALLLSEALGELAPSAKPVLCDEFVLVSA